MSFAAKRMLSMGLIAAGVLFMIAVGMQVMPERYALFAGVACFVLGGMVWAIPSADGK